MERTEMQDWILTIALEATKQAAAERLQAPFHFDVYLDNQMGGRLCSFEVTGDGKLLWFTFNDDVAARSEFPLRLKLSTGDGEWRGATIRESSWVLWNPRTVLQM